MNDNVALDTSARLEVVDDLAPQVCWYCSPCAGASGRRKP